MRQRSWSITYHDTASDGSIPVPLLRSTSVSLTSRAKATTMQQSPSMDIGTSALISDGACIVPTLACRQGAVGKALDRSARRPGTGPAWARPGSAEAVPVAFTTLPAPKPAKRTLMNFRWPGPGLLEVRCVAVWHDRQVYGEKSKSERTRRRCCRSHRGTRWPEADFRSDCALLGSRPVDKVVSHANARSHKLYGAQTLTSANPIMRKMT